MGQLDQKCFIAALHELPEDLDLAELQEFTGALVIHDDPLLSRQRGQGILRGIDGEHHGVLAQRIGDS